MAKSGTAFSPACSPTSISQPPGIRCTVMGVLGGLSAPLNQFLTPNMIVPSITFAVWISLVLGGKEHAYGAMLGVFVTFGLFDILIETYAPVSPEFAQVVPNFKLFLYGALLVGVLLFRPRGILDEVGDNKQATQTFGKLTQVVKTRAKSVAKTSVAKLNTKLNGPDNPPVFTHREEDK